MRKNVIFFCFIFCCQVSISQEFIWKLSSYKKGVYKTYVEFITNNPSQDLTTMEVLDKKAPYGLMGFEKLEVKRFKIKDKAAKNIGGIAGFSDGTNVYINPSALQGFNSKTNFYRIEFYGTFGFLDFIKKSTIRNGSYTSNQYSKAHGVFNLSTGNFVELDKNNLRELLKKYPELLQDFENEKGKNEKVKDYFIKFVKKQSENQSTGK